jgi:hypothetical protein
MLMAERIPAYLLLLLVCGPAAAEPVNEPAKTAAVHPPATPKEVKNTPAGPANLLFGSVPGPASLAARAIGSYARGCLAGAVSLPINGPDWQVMRLSRDRNWGHPRLLDFLERFANDARHLDHWPGLLVGDMSQPRGGPMVTGHSSHQIGLDVDIWLTPMPDRILTPQERENMTAVSMLKDPFTVDPDKWTPLHTKLIKRAASYPQGVGTVVKLGRRYLHVPMDISGEVVKYDEGDVDSVADNAGHSPIMLYTHLRALGHSHAAISRWLDDPEWRKVCRQCRKMPTVQLEGGLQIDPEVLK